jgi:hypothetical protein
MASLLIDRIRGNDPTLSNMFVAYDFPAGRDSMCLMARPLLEDPPTPERIFKREVEIIDFCKALSKNTSIMDIEIHGWLQASDPYIRRLTAAISQMKELKHLCCGILEFRTERFAIELGNLVASLSKLEEVKIECALMEFDFSILASALAVHPTVEKFSLDVHVSPEHANQDFRTSFDCLGRALLSAPNLRVVELAVPWVANRATIAPVLAQPTPPPFSAFFGDDLLESLLLRPMIKEVALFYFPLDDNACGLLCGGLEHSSSLQKLTLQGCGISETNYVSIFNMLQRLETLQDFRLSICIPFRTTGAIALYRFLTESKSLKRLAFLQAEELWQRRPYYIVSPTHEETHDYASYAVVRSLLKDTSWRELELCCFRMETVGYLDFEASLNEDNLEDPKNAGVASLLTTVLLSKSNLISLHLTNCLTNDNTYTLIIRSLWDNKSLLSLNTALENSADLGLLFGDRESTGFDRNAIILDLVRCNRYIENIELEGILQNDALEEMMFGAKENRLKKEREQEEVLGWLHLNRKGRRDISMEYTRKSRAVELLIETKENTHCAFTMLLESPSLYF